MACLSIRVCLDLVWPKDLMKMVDTNGDGEIDFQEFMQMMRS